MQRAASGNTPHEVHVVVVVLLPCAVIYSLERSLKLRFLSTAASTASTFAAAGREGGPGAITAASDGVQLQDVRRGDQHEPRQQQQPHLSRRQRQQQQQQLSTQGLPHAARPWLVGGQPSSTAAGCPQLRPTHVCPRYVINDAVCIADGGCDACPCGVLVCL